MKLTSNTSSGRILLAMQKCPNIKWYIKDFTKSPIFVGYEAGTRMGDLRRAGLVRVSDKKDGIFCTYEITDSGKEYKVQIEKLEDKSYIFKKETTMHDSYRNKICVEQENIFQYIFRKLFR